MFYFQHIFENRFIKWAEPFGWLIPPELKVDSRHHYLMKPSVTMSLRAVIWLSNTAPYYLYIYTTVCLRSAINYVHLPRYSLKVQMAHAVRFSQSYLQYFSCETEIWFSREKKRIEKWYGEISVKQIIIYSNMVK